MPGRQYTLTVRFSFDVTLRKWVGFFQTEFDVLKGFVQGVVLPPKWRKLCSCCKLVLRESLEAGFLVLTCSTMTGM